MRSDAATKRWYSRHRVESSEWEEARVIVFGISSTSIEFSRPTTAGRRVRTIVWFSRRVYTRRRPTVIPSVRRWFHGTGTAGSVAAPTATCSSSQRFIGVPPRRRSNTSAITAPSSESHHYQIGLCRTPKNLLRRLTSCRPDNFSHRPVFHMYATVGFKSLLTTGCFVFSIVSMLPCILPCIWSKLPEINE